MYLVTPPLTLTPSHPPEPYVPEYHLTPKKEGNKEYKKGTETTGAIPKKNKEVLFVRVLQLLPVREVSGVL